MTNVNDRYDRMRGGIRVFKQHSGYLQPFCHNPNVVVYQAADILASMLAGNDMRPTHIGFMYAPTAATITTPTRGGTMATIATDLAAVTGNMVVSSLATGTLSVDGDADVYAGNKVSLHAISDISATPVFTGVSYAGAPTPGDDSFKQVALLTQVSAPGSLTPEYSLFARSALSSDFVIALGFELALFWDISFF